MQDTLSRVQQWLTEARKNRTWGTVEVSVKRHPLPRVKFTTQIQIQPQEETWITNVR
jgi:hypothetical protein